MTRFAEVSLQWNTGFPPETGIYLVELDDGEHVVTPYRPPEDGIIDAYGALRGIGWFLQTRWRGKVFAWAVIHPATAVSG